MGYFSNGSEGDAFSAQYCARCVHGETPCAVWNAHMLLNYAECSNPNSILHLLIPRGPDGENQQCRMFVQARAEA